MTEALYLEDSTVREFDATVERTVDDRVVLDRTHFYPEGGGQPADRGRLAIRTEGDAGTRSEIETGSGTGTGSGTETESGTETGSGTDTGTDRWTVTDVQKKDTVYHHLDGDPPPEGTPVTGRIDWDRRYAHMRYHTAQHLLSAHLLSEYDAGTVGNQLYADRARIDVEQDRFSDDDLSAIEARLNDLVEDAREVTWYTMEREHAEETLDPERTRIDLLPDSVTDLRIVEIEGIDRTACAGTHVSNTERIGTVRVTGRQTKGQDAERLTFELED